MRVPSSVRTVAEVIGMDAAVRLMRASYGNRQVYVPARDIPQDHRLSSVLAPDELKALKQTFGGELLPYPSARGMKRKAEAERKARAILQCLVEGMGTAQIAERFKVSQRYVCRLRSKGTTSSGWTRRQKQE